MKSTSPLLDRVGEQRFGEPMDVSLDLADRALRECAIGQRPQPTMFLSIGREEQRPQLRGQFGHALEVGLDGPGEVVGEALRVLQHRLTFRVAKDVHSGQDRVAKCGALIAQRAKCWERISLEGHVQSVEGVRARRREWILDCSIAPAGHFRINTSHS
jgi:hypothetical protein